MKAKADRLLLLALLGVWMYLCWPHLSEQVSNTRQARAALASLSWEDRAAAVDPPGYRVAEEIARVVPACGCVLVLGYTGPEHLRYYQSRFAYYLYPRRVRFSDQTDAPAGGCAFLAVFRDTPASLAQEPFRGRWDEERLRQRTAALTRLFAEERVEIFR